MAHRCTFECTDCCTFRSHCACSSRRYFDILLHCTERRLRVRDLSHIHYAYARPRPRHRHRRKKECTRSVKKRSGPAKGTKYAPRRPRSQDERASAPVRLGETSLTCAGSWALRIRVHREQCHLHLLVLTCTTVRRALMSYCRHRHPPDFARTSYERWHREHDLVNPQCPSSAAGGRAGSKYRRNRWGRIDRESFGRRIDGRSSRKSSHGWWTLQ